MIGIEYRPIDRRFNRTVKELPYASGPPYILSLSRTAAVAMTTGGSGSGPAQQERSAAQVPRSLPSLLACQHQHLSALSAAFLHELQTRPCHPFSQSSLFWPPSTTFASRFGCLLAPRRVKLRPIWSSSSYSPPRCLDAAAPPLASGLLEPPLRPSPTFIFVEHQAMMLLLQFFRFSLYIEVLKSLITPMVFGLQELVLLGDVLPLLRA